MAQLLLTLKKNRPTLIFLALYILNFFWHIHNSQVHRKTMPVTEGEIGNKVASGEGLMYGWLLIVLVGSAAAVGYLLAAIIQKENRAVHLITSAIFAFSVWIIIII